MAGERGCTAKRADGKDCNAPAVTGTPFCRWHAPAPQFPRTPEGWTTALAEGTMADQVEAGLITGAALSNEKATAFLCAFLDCPPDELGARLVEMDAIMAGVKAIVASVPGEAREIPPETRARLNALLPPEAIRRFLVATSELLHPADPAAAIPAALARDLPAILPHMTSEEPRALLEAVARGRTCEWWKAAEDDRGQFYSWAHPKRPGGHEVRLRPPEHISAGEWGRDKIERELVSTLQGWDLNTAYTVAVTLAALADATQTNAAAIASGAVAPVIDLDIDQVLLALGKRRTDGRQKWNEYRRDVRRRQLELSRAAVVGARRGKYRTPDTREELDTFQEEELYFVRDRETTWLDDQPALDGSAVPLRLRVYGGGLWRKIARHPAMLQYLGDFRALADIPSEQTSGQWARAMALSYVQRVRETKNPCPKLTRRDLLMGFPPNPTPREVAESGKPQRVKLYWKRAKKDLITVGYWRDFSEPEEPDTRYGWLDLWLDQEVIPTAGPLLEEPLPALAAESKAAEQRRRGSKRRRG